MADEVDLRDEVEYLRTLVDSLVKQLAERNQPAPVVLPAPPPVIIERPDPWWERRYRPMWIADTSGTTANPSWSATKHLVAPEHRRR